MPPALIRLNSFYGGGFREQHFELTRWGEVEHDWKADRLYLDYDTSRTIGSLFNICSTLRILGIRARWINYSRSRHGWHIIIALNCKLHIVETIAAQSILGSDAKREALNLMRARAIAKGRYSKWAIKRFNLLFSQKLR